MKCLILQENQMEKFYIVPKDSELGIEYNKFLSLVNKITTLYKEFVKDKFIHTSSFYPMVTRLWIDADEVDMKIFANDFLADTPGKFKARSPLNKEWVSLCKENGLTKNAHKPYVPFYFSFGCAKCSWRLFDLNDVIYCTFSTENSFSAPDDIVEIKGSEFYKIIEKYNVNL